MRHTISMSISANGATSGIVWAQPHSQANGRPHVQAGLVRRTALLLNELGEAVPKHVLGEAVPKLGIH